MKNLKLGIITEDEFVNSFATTQQKKTYQKINNFKGITRDTVLKEARRYCTIDYLGNKQYEITKIYKRPISKEFSKMKSSLYKYIVPLILDQLIVGHDKNNKISFTCGRCAREINMINCNYNLLKNNREVIADGTGKYALSINNNNLNDFYEKSDSMINMYINKSLEYLKKSGSIIWQKVYITYKEKINNESIVENDNGELVGKIIVDKHTSTEEELDYYTKCIEIADDKSGLLKTYNEQDANSGRYMELNTMRYYSKFAKRWNNILCAELKKKDIKYIYQAYEAYYISLDYCNDLKKNFADYDNIEKLTTDFNNEFISMIMKNANKRFENKKEKYNDNYILDFECLTDMTINHKTENLYERFKDVIDDKNTKKTKLSKMRGEIK